MQTPIKQCIVCHAQKPITDFYKNINCTTDGHEGRCKECRKAYQEELRDKDRDEYRRKAREYERQHKGQAKERMAAWLTTNKERKAEGDRVWRRNNPDKTKDQRRVQNARRRALVASAEGNYTPAEWRKLKTQYGNRCLACGRSEPEVRITPDHVVPLALGGRNSIDNIQPLCWGCNAAKQAREITDYR